MECQYRILYILKGKRYGGRPL